MNIKYDKEVDAAYISLREIGPGDAVNTYCCNPHEVGGMINLDFDKEGRLIGIEVFDAAKKLPLNLL